MKLTEEQENFLNYLVQDLRQRYGKDRKEILETGYPVPESFERKFKLHLDVEFNRADEVFHELEDKNILVVEEKKQEMDRGKYSINYPDGIKSTREIDFKGAVKGTEKRKYLYIRESVMDEIEDEIL